MKYYAVTVLREAGPDPIIGKHLEAAEEELIVEAVDKDEAYRKSLTGSTLKFFGQVRRTFIDEEEYKNPNF